MCQGRPREAAGCGDRSVVDLRLETWCPARRLLDVSLKANLEARDAMPRRAARALPLFCCPAAAPAPTTDQISYLHSGANATTRTLTSVLGERLSVRDFGATGDCLPAGRDVVTNASCAVDDTPAFVAALVWLKAARWDGGALHVPPGEYRIDGTVNLYGASMHLQYGARLKRVRLKEVAQSSNSAPVVRLATANSKLTGALLLL